MLSIGNLKPPRPKDYRVVVATDAADLRRVAKHLSHSSETSRKYYEFTNTMMHCELTKLYLIFLKDENGPKNTLELCLKNGY